jgi:DNA-binding PadR family transcriptional regulator
MKRPSEPEPDTLLPLPSATLHILLALAEGERHGYAIKKEVARLTRDKVQLGPGTLYGAIKNLLLTGLIEESEDRPELYLDDERRRYYRLSPFGRRVLNAEVQRLRELIRVAETRGAVLNSKPA